MEILMNHLNSFILVEKCWEDQHLMSVYFQILNIDMMIICIIIRSFIQI